MNVAFMEIARAGWIVWDVLWLAFTFALLRGCRRWDRVSVGNLIFHLVAGLIANLLFWAAWVDSSRVLGLLIVYYYSYEFMWHPILGSRPVALARNDRSSRK